MLGQAYLVSVYLVETKTHDLGDKIPVIGGGGGGCILCL